MSTPDQPGGQPDGPPPPFPPQPPVAPPQAPMAPPAGGPPPPGALGGPPPPGAQQFPPPPGAQQFPGGPTPPPQFTQGVPPYPAVGAPSAGSNGLAIAALVVGLIALLCLGFLAGVPAVILGYLGLQRSKEMGDVGKGQAIAGIVLGAVAIAWSALWVIIIIASSGSSV